MGFSVALFLFAHQDDEFGVYQQIEEERAAGRRVVCAYLTNGEYSGVPSRIRNNESLRVLTDIGLAQEDVFFIGEQLGIADGKLPEHLAQAQGWLSRTLKAWRPVATYVPAWEGGHQDHDALHAIAVHVAAEHGLSDTMWQFSLYNSYRLRPPLFRVLSPLAANGPVFERRIPWRRRTRHLRYCLCYSSQKWSWLGLFPFVVMHYVVRGSQALQRVKSVRTHSRPHEGQLYYEARGFFRWEDLLEKLRCQFHSFEPNN